MLLALERSGAVASAAVFDRAQGRLVATAAAPAGGRGDAWPLVREALGNAAIDATKLTALAVGTGPGSFSGIRAALAVATGLALPDELPVFGVLSAAAAVRKWRAENPSGSRAIVLGDARRGHVWRFDEPDGDGAWRALSHTAADISLLSSPEADPGDETAPLSEALAADGAGRSILLADPRRLAWVAAKFGGEPAAADAETVGRMALAGLCGPALPVYLHEAVAERRKS